MKNSEKQGVEGRFKIQEKTTKEAVGWRVNIVAARHMIGTWLVTKAQKTPKEYVNEG